MFTPRPRSSAKPPINKEIVGWPRGYMSSPQGNLPEDALSDLKNMDLDEMSMGTPRPSLIAYGQPYIGTCIGMGTFQKEVAGKPERYEISMQAVQADEVQQITITGGPTGGTFTLTYSGQTTAAITFNASPATVQAALIALSNIGPSDVVCSGDNLPSGAIDVRFTGTLANTDVALMTANGRTCYTESCSRT
jgi:hypothetical protein